MNDFNFFSVYEKRKGIKFDLDSPYFMGVVILIICVIFSIGFLSRNLILNIQISAMTKKIETIKQTDDYATANDLQNSINAMVNYDTSAALALKKYQDAKVLDSGLVSSLLSGVPANVSVVSFGISDTGFGMTCNVPNRKIAAELIQDLKATGLCQEIQLNSVTNNPDGSGCVVSIDGVLKAGTQK
jgi:hypothetical protein